MAITTIEEIVDVHIEHGYRIELWNKTWTALAGSPTLHDVPMVGWLTLVETKVDKKTGEPIEDQPPKAERPTRRCPAYADPATGQVRDATKLDNYYRYALDTPVTKTGRASELRPQWEAWKKDHAKIVAKWPGSTTN
jgi:hypothetical protein